MREDQSSKEFDAVFWNCQQGRNIISPLNVKVWFPIVVIVCLFVFSFAYCIKKKLQDSSNATQPIGSNGSVPKLATTCLAALHMVHYFTVVFGQTWLHWLWLTAVLRLPFQDVQLSWRFLWFSSSKMISFRIVPSLSVVHFRILQPLVTLAFTTPIFEFAGKTVVT